MGSDSVRAFYDAQPGRFFRRCLGGDMSRAGDLAYTYGSYRFRGKKAGNEMGGYYLTIWQNGGKEDRRIVLDLESALPKEKQ
jgi:hypothetical protein